MLKGLGACLVILASTGIGYLFSLQLTRRYQQLKVVRRCMMLLKGEISFGKSTLPEAFLHIGKKVEEPFQRFFLDLSQKASEYRGKTLEVLFTEGVKQNLENSYLSEKDKEGFQVMGKYLGYLDVAMQMHTLDLYLQELELEIKEVGSTILVKKKLYQTLGIMSGLFLAITLA